ncbi:hypothetical protein D9M70_404180 [compost metagenome]
MHAVDPPTEAGGGEEHDDAVDRCRDRHGRVVQQHRAQRQGDGQGAVVDADLHADGHRLALRQVEQARHAVADAEAQQVEAQRRQADHRGVLEEGRPVLGHRQQDDQRQEQRRDDLHRLLHALGERREAAAHPHADGHRAEHDGEHLHDLGELQRDGLVALHEVHQRQVDDHRHGEDGDHRVHRRQGDVQRHVAMRQVAVEVGRGTARRGGQQHHAHRQRRLELEALGDEEAGQRQQQDLAAEADQHRFGEFDHPGEVRQGQRQPQAEHDDAQRQGQENRTQQACSHSYCSPEGTARILRNRSRTR